MSPGSIVVYPQNILFVQSTEKRLLCLKIQIIQTTVLQTALATQARMLQTQLATAQALTNQAMPITVARMLITQADAIKALTAARMLQTRADKPVCKSNFVQPFIINY